MATSNRNPTSRRKLALIIGNDDYSQPCNKLDQCTNNISDLNDLLETINFDVSPYCNLTRRQMKSRVTEFSKKINNGDLIFFYFSGHGYQCDNKNYLIPVDDEGIEIDKDAEDFATNFKRILEELVIKDRTYVAIFILDCWKPYLLKDARASDCK
jgi:uncharacterized caspase-like protein